MSIMTPSIPDRLHNVRSRQLRRLPSGVKPTPERPEPLGLSLRREEADRYLEIRRELFGAAWEPGPLLTIAPEPAETPEPDEAPEPWPPPVTAASMAVLEASMIDPRRDAIARRTGLPRERVMRHVEALDAAGLWPHAKPPKRRKAD
jgi:hypothetical protein